MLGVQARFRWQTGMRLALRKGRRPPFPGVLSPTRMALGKGRKIELMVGFPVLLSFLTAGGREPAVIDLIERSQGPAIYEDVDLIRLLAIERRDDL